MDTVWEDPLALEFVFESFPSNLFDIANLSRKEDVFARTLV